MQNIYDNVADLCSFVIRSCTEDFFVKYSCISPAERDRAAALVQAEVGELFQETPLGPSRYKIRQIESQDLTEDFFARLENLSERLKSEKDFFCVAGLIQILDESLETMLVAKIKEFEEDDFSVVLNGNRETTGIGLLPRCSCVWERTHRMSHSYNRMDNFLFNMLLMENTILGELIDKHIFLKRNLFTEFAKTRRLKIAATPLRLEKQFEAVPYDHENIQYFKIRYTESDFSKSNELIWKKITTAADNRADIVVFPEMLGNPEMVDYVSGKLKALSAEETKNIPSLIILPSFWENNHNSVTILDKFGNVICKQGKQNPFRSEREGSGRLEGIFANLVINIFHFQGIGRLAILICKDFLTTKYLEQLMRCFKLTLIVVPSFSTGSYDFRRSFDLCAHDDCNVVWINTCAAIRKGKEANFESVGYVRKRVSRNDDESQMLSKMTICDGAFEGKCNHDCLFYETIQGV